ncbi:MAG TPA: MBL fold metallo-hydrolase [Streptosporangiaceae bacterium]|nr:MBL fold metallo-hydrolase [Streptosporangiaceae bacterium]
MTEIITIETPALGDRSYLIHDGALAMVVDPQRDIDRVLAVAQDRQVRITHVLETHIHNDYVTGGFALARQAGAEYVVAASEEVSFERLAVRDRDQLTSGSMTVTVMHTPGHTPGHLSFVLSEPGHDPGAVFTGGSMLYGAVGRTDLIGPEHTRQLTRAQYRSVRRLAEALPDEAAVYPTHGFGSFCSATPTSGTASTIGHERQVNVALRTEEDAFVTELIAGLNAYPRYYAHMGPANRRGPQAPGLTQPTLADPAELRRRIEAGEWVVDLRERRAFARAHVTGTISVELGDPFSTYLGWTIPWGAPLTLIGDSPRQVAEAQLQLTRIGIDHIASAAAGPTETLALGHVSGYRVTDFGALAAEWGRPGLVVLDVRRPDEWQAGHLARAVHIPFWEVERRAGEVPPGEVWVHCASGFRAAIGASILDRAGRTVVHVDDNWEMAAQAGLPLAPQRQS